MNEYRALVYHPVLRPRTGVPGDSDRYPEYTGVYSIPFKFLTLADFRL